MIVSSQRSVSIRIAFVLLFFPPFGRAEESGWQGISEIFGRVGFPESSTHFHFDPRGGKIATYSSVGQSWEVSNAESGRIEGEGSMGDVGFADEIRFSNDGSRLWLVEHDDTGIAGEAFSVWHWRSGVRLRTGSDFVLRRGAWLRAIASPGLNRVGLIGFRARGANAETAAIRLIDTNPAIWSDMLGFPGIDERTMMAFSQDGSAVAVALGQKAIYRSSDGTIQDWELPESIVDVRFSKDDKQVVVTHIEGTVCLAVDGTEEPVRRVEWSIDRETKIFYDAALSRALLISSKDKPSLVDLETGADVTPQSWKMSGVTTRARMDAGGEFIFVVSAEKDGEAGGAPSRISAELWTLIGENVARLWRVDDRFEDVQAELQFAAEASMHTRKGEPKLVVQSGLANSPFSVRPLLEHRLLAGTDGDLVVVWNIDSGAEVARLAAPHFSPTEAFLSVESYRRPGAGEEKLRFDVVGIQRDSDGLNPSLVIWDLGSNEIRQRWEHLSSPTRDGSPIRMAELLGVSTNAEWAATVRPAGGGENRIVVESLDLRPESRWSLPAREDLVGGNSECYVSPDGETLVFSGTEFTEDLTMPETVTVSVWTRGGGEIARFSCEEPEILFGEKSETIGIVTDSELSLVNVATGSRQNLPMLTVGEFDECKFSPDGRFLLITRDMGGGEVFSLPDGKRILTLEQCYMESTKFSPAGNTLITGVDEELHHTARYEKPDGGVIRLRTSAGGEVSADVEDGGFRPVEYLPGGGPIRNWDELFGAEEIMIGGDRYPKEEFFDQLVDKENWKRTGVTVYELSDASAVRVWDSLADMVIGEIRNGDESTGVDRSGLESVVSIHCFGEYFLVCGSEEEGMELWDQGKRKRIRTFRTNAAARGVERSLGQYSDGNALFFAGFSNVISAWHRRWGNEVWRFESGLLGSDYLLLREMMISPDEKRLLAVFKDMAESNVWILGEIDALSGSLLRKFEAERIVLGQSGGYFLAEEDGVVNLLSLASDEFKILLGGANASPDEWGFDQSQYLDDTKVSVSDNNRLMMLLCGSSLTLRSLPEGSVLSTHDLEVIERAHTDSLLPGLGFQSVFDACLSGDGKFLTVSSGTEGWFHRVDPSTGIMSPSEGIVSGDPVYVYPGVLMPVNNDVGMLVDVGTGEATHVFRDMNGVSGGKPALSTEREFLMGATSSGLQIWDLENGKRSTALAQFFAGDGSEPHWFWSTPDGRFDTNRIDSVPDLFWVLPAAPTEALAPETFVGFFYEPGLFSKAMSRSLIPRPGIRYWSLSMNRPVVEFGNLSLLPGTPPRARVGVRVRNPEMEGVYDLRLFRDGRLVAQFPPPESGSGAEENDVERWRNRRGIFTETERSEWVGEFDIGLANGAEGEKVEFSAYAFNRDRMKGNTAKESLKLVEAVVNRPAKAVLVGIGVTGGTVGWQLGAGRKEAKGTIRMFSDFLRKTGQIPQANIETKLLVRPSPYRSYQEHEAPIDPTKVNIRRILRELAENLRPDDLLVLSISAHGIYIDDQFYIAPSDADPHEQGADFTEKKLASLISGDELSFWLREIDCDSTFLILDTCQSAGGVLSGGFRPGPMGSRGLGQLAWDRRIPILVASETQQVAAANYLYKSLRYQVREKKEEDSAAPVDEQIREILRATEARIEELLIVETPMDRRQTQLPRLFEFIPK